MSVTALSCPQCGAPVRVTAAGRTLSVICGGCGATLDAATPELKLLAEGAAALAIPEIPLGTRGVLDAVEWEVVGYLERSADGEGWREYLLFNPWESYAWLVDTGEFKLGRAMLAEPETVDRVAYVGDDRWEGRSRYEASVTLALGEFPWRVSVGETVAVAEYDRGDRTLSRETTAEETSWTLLVPMAPGTVEAAFGLGERGTEAEPGPPIPSLWPQFTMVAGIAFVLLILVDSPFRASSPLPVANLQVPIGGADVSVTAGPIVLPPGRHKVKIEAEALGTGLDNEWIDLDYTLVDRRSQTSYAVSAVAEQYHGVDSGGRWSEGNTRPDVSLSSIPGGSYDLIIEARGQRWPAPGPFDPPSADQPRRRLLVSISAGGTFGGNFVLALVLLFAWPLLVVNGAGEREEEDEW